MRKFTFTKLRLFCMALVLPFILFSCKDRFDEHYEVPDWLSGSVWETLEEMGNYSIFLEGVELAGYRPIMEGKNILTAMAPNDDAFNTYLGDNNYSSISNIPQDELKKLIGYHLLYYSYNKEKFINFRPEGDLATEEQKEANAGQFFKHRTRGQEAPTHLGMIDGHDVTVYHQEKFLPVFSNLFFQTRDIDAKSNYEYFYPNSSWTAGSNGFNVSNASVEDYEIIADNGYIYKIDAVIEPLNTLMGEMKKRADYSIFAELYDVYENYDDQGAKEYTKKYGASLGVDTLYLYKHYGFPSIGLEWIDDDYTEFQKNARDGYSIFAPTNDVLNGFYDSYWKGYGYTSIKDVERTLMSYVLGQYICSYMAFPEDFSKGNIEDTYGNIVDINPNDIPVSARAMCTNGTFYGVTESRLPQYFVSVMAPAFKYKDRRAFMYALSYSGSMVTYGSAVTNYLMFMPDEETMKQSGYEIQTVNNESFLGYQPESDWVTVNSTLAQSIVRIHTSQSDTRLNPNETRVLNAQTAFNYLYVKDNQITDNVTFNRLLNPGYDDSPFTPFTEVLDNGDSWLNGQAFFYSAPEKGIFQTVSGTVNSLFGSTNDSRYSFYWFLQLLKSAEMIENGTMPFLSVSPRTVIFVPTKEAIEKALAVNAIPGIQGGYFNANNELEWDELKEEDLRSYLLNYFISNANNSMIDYPFIGSRFSTGSYVTMNLTQNVIYTDNGNSLSVRLEGGNTVNVTNDYDYFPFVYTDGCFHFIDNVL